MPIPPRTAQSPEEGRCLDGERWSRQV
jgi:hypothetical protein